jgi:hypothetical protein
MNSTLVVAKRAGKCNYSFAATHAQLDECKRARPTILARLANRREVGSKISGKTMEATSTNGSVMVSPKFRVVTRMAAATLR